MARTEIQLCAVNDFGVDAGWSTVRLAVTRIAIENYGNFTRESITANRQNGVGRSTQNGRAPTHRNQRVKRSVM